MTTIKLTTPERSRNPTITVNPSAKTIQAALNALPLANSSESGAKIVSLLKNLNRIPLDTQARIEIMKLILPLVDGILGALRSQYISSSLPLADRPQQQANLVRELVTELGYGYKIIVTDLIEDQAATGIGSSALPQAILDATSMLARLLVDCYILYVPEPRKIWLELNQLYQYAEKHGFHEATLRVTQPDHEPNPPTIANCYRRVLLLSLMNPYHLMQGEALKAFNFLRTTAPHCHLRYLGQAILPQGALFVDLAVDTPPMHAPKASANVRPLDGRLLDIAPLLAAVQAEIRRLTIEGKAATRQSTLAQRMERDMYFRWFESWGVRRDRLSQRQPRQMPTTLLCGLTAAHHMISDGQPFKPEETEISIRGHRARISTADMSLVPEDHQPWMLERGQSKTGGAMAGAASARTSKFDPLGAGHDKEMWIKVYAASADVVDELLGKAKVEFQQHGCEIRNANQGGFGIHCPVESQFPGRVGELVAAQPSRQGGWAVGSVRWMKIDDGIQLGVRVIAENARAVAVKAVLGIGNGGEYYRALLVPDLDPSQHPTTLITPAAVYDIGSVLMLTMPDKIMFARLTRQIESTSAFSHYQFELVDEPSLEEIASESKDERKSTRMYR